MRTIEVGGIRPNLNVNHALNLIVASFVEKDIMSGANLPQNVSNAQTELGDSMNNQSFIKAVFGAFLIFAGVAFVVAGLGVGAIYLLGNLPSYASLGVLGIVLGAGMIYYGFQTVWNNENPIVKVLLFLIGLQWTLAGVVLIAGGASIPASVIMIIVGVTLLDHVLKTRIWERVRKVVGL